MKKIYKDLARDVSTARAYLTLCLSDLEKEFLFDTERDLKSAKYWLGYALKRIERFYEEARFDSVSIRMGKEKEKDN